MNFSSKRLLRITLIGGVRVSEQPVTQNPGAPAATNTTAPPPVIAAMTRPTFGFEQGHYRRPAANRTADSFSRLTYFVAFHPIRLFQNTIQLRSAVASRFF